MAFLTGAADSGGRRGSGPSWQNLGGAKLCLCPSIWQILQAGLVTTGSLYYRAGEMIPEVGGGGGGLGLGGPEEKGP